VENFALRLTIDLGLCQRCSVSVQLRTGGTAVIWSCE